MTAQLAIGMTLLLVMLPASAGTRQAAAAVTGERLLSLNLCYDQLLINHAPQHIAALTRYATAADLPTHDGSLESILSAEPDRVLANRFNDPLLVTALRRRGVVVTVLPEPSSLDEVAVFWREFAAAINQPELANTQLQAWQRQVDAVNQSPTPLQVVNWQANHLSFGGGSLWHEVVTALGMENLPAQLGNGLVRVAPEQLLLWQPDRVVTRSSSDSFALAELGYQHAALQPLLAKVQVRLPGRLLDCMAQNLPAVAQALVAIGDDHASD